jgi:hypothetical protein
MKNIGLILIVMLLYNAAWAQSSAKDAIRMGQQNAQAARDYRKQLFQEAQQKARGPAAPSTPYIIYPPPPTDKKVVHHKHCEDCPPPAETITISPSSSEPAWVDSSSSSDSLSWDK